MFKLYLLFSIYLFEWSKDYSAPLIEWIAEHQDDILTFRTSHGAYTLRAHQIRYFTIALELAMTSTSLLYLLILFELLRQGPQTRVPETWKRHFIAVYVFWKRFFFKLLKLSSYNCDIIFNFFSYRSFLYVYRFSFSWDGYEIYFEISYLILSYLISAVYLIKK